MPKEPNKEQFNNWMSRVNATVKNVNESSPEATQVHVSAETKTQANKKTEAAKKEVKKRTTFALYPSTIKNAKRVVYINRTSLSAIVEDALRKYISDNLKALKEFDELPAEQREKVDNAKE